MDYQENKKYQIKLRNKFKDELDQIYFYLSKILKEPSIANNFHKKVYKTISTLSYFPERYQKISVTKNIRRIPINGYIILYSVNHDTRSSFYFYIFSIVDKII